MELTKLIEQLIEKIEVPKQNLNYNYVPEILNNLIKKDYYNDKDIFYIEKLSFKLEINNKLKRYYSNEWKKITEENLIEPWQTIFSIILYKKFISDKKKNNELEMLFKIINTLLKSLEMSKNQNNDACISNINSIISKDIISFIEENNKNIPLDEEKIDFISIKNAEFKTIPLTLLFFEGPIARSYAETLYSLNIKPERIINIISSVDLVSKKKIGKYFHKFLKKLLAILSQKTRIHYWSNFIIKNYPELYENILNTVQTTFSFNKKTILDSHKLKNLKFYSNQVDQVLIENLNDKKLYEYLENTENTTILFTGGGMLPETLLTMKKHRYIHIHPGYLPKIRGADCFLWSTLLKGKPSVSCFYMSSKIDMGEIILAEWLPKFTLKIPLNKYPLKIIYRSIYAFVDPWVRSYGLRELICKNTNFDKFDTKSQTELDGITFHFMNNQIQKKLFENFYQNKNS